MKKRIILLLLLCILILSTNNIAYAENEWSEWSEVVPPSGVTMESRTEYRYKTMIKTTSYEPSLEGYMCSGSMWEQTGSGSVDYVDFFPTGFDKEHLFYIKLNTQPIKEAETMTNKTTVSTRVLGYVYYHWCRNGDYSEKSKDRTVSDTYSEEFWKFHAFMTNKALEWDNDKGCFYNNSSHCNDSSRWIGHGEGNAANIQRNRCSYVNYRKLFSYYKWSEYSNWSVVKPTESDECLVEERKVYRYLKETDKNKPLSTPTTMPDSTQNSNEKLDTESEIKVETNKKSKNKYKVGKLITDKKISYKIKTIKGRGGTVEVKKVKNKKAKSIKIPKWVKVNGYRFTIIGIGENAFSSCSKVKKIQLKTTTLKYVHKRAFKGLNKKKYKIVVPQKCLKKYSKLFSKR